MDLNVSKRNIGVNFNNSGTADILLWAPLAKKVQLINCSANKNLFLEKAEYGYWIAKTSGLQPGDRYKFSIDDGEAYPDPASLSQADGVHEASVALDIKSFNWTDTTWKNISLEQYILYEVHTGTFSNEHNFEGIENKLDHLTDLGINAIEIMPVGQFPGSRNWGYDGVYPFAVQQSYGGAKALQKLVNTCHEKGISVILDVIYNHLGPEGNYLPMFGPYFTGKYSTPWGKAINYDDAWCDGVRQYFIENALMWFRDFHIDALRMDAVHAIKDFSPVHIIKEIKQYTNELMKVTGRNHYLIAEMDLNDPVFINPAEKGGFGVDAQWMDEFHHALRVASGQKREGYYSDFNGLPHLAKSYTDAYVYDGQFSKHRKKKFGIKTNNPGKQFVVFSQNHDHTGNRMMGERTSQLVSHEMCKLMAAAVMVSPYVPMLFMGEEWAETNPFLFFISHTDKELTAIVNKGRKAEFSHFNWQGEPPDPEKEETFNSSLLQWQLLKEEKHKAMYEYYKKLINLRKTSPALKHLDRNNTTALTDEKNKILTLHRWHETQHLVCVMNFSDKEQRISSDGELIFNSSDNYRKNHIQPESILIYRKI
jgi:maltooligosyltrehalose trehalohydrolase